MNPGDFLIVGPGCASNVIDESDEASDLLVWLWRTPPVSATCTIDPKTYRRWSAGTRLWRTLDQLHGLCREEIERPDELSKLAARQLHLSIDLAVARFLRPKIRPPKALIGENGFVESESRRNPD